MKIKTNCELPWAMISNGLNETLNDYDFILFHLCKDHPEYMKHFTNRRNRLSIMDNSAYEFFIKGEQLDLNEFAEYVNMVKPRMYLLPDKLMDKEATLRMSEEFLRNQAWNIHAEPMAVVQGNSLEEFEECVDKYIEWCVKYVAIPFHNSFLKGLRGELPQVGQAGLIGEDDDSLYARGRIELVNRLQSKLRQFCHIHFLGSHNPREKAVLDYILSDYTGVVTMDTGYPVKYAIEGKSLKDKEYKKPHIIIDEFFELDGLDVNLIKDNVIYFREHL